MPNCRLNQIKGERLMPKTKDEFDCLLSMRDLGKYVGKWIAVVDGEIVSVGSSGKEVLRASREKFPKNTPLILKVPSYSVMLL